MAKKATKAAKAAEVVSRVGLGWWSRYTTDIAVVGVEPEVLATLDAPTQKKVLVAMQEGKAAVQKTLADANTQIAGILKSGG